jgi:hypothetical protein
VEEKYTGSNEDVVPDCSSDHVKDGVASDTTNNKPDVVG